MAKSKRVYPLSDHIEAMQNHSEYARYLKLWQSRILKEEKGLPLTPEEDALSNAPRSRFSHEAEAEARYQLLSRTKRELDTMSEERWAIRVDVDEIQQYAIIYVPLDLPRKPVLKELDVILRECKKQYGRSSPQRTRRPEVEPWLVVRMIEKEKLTPPQIVAKLKLVKAERGTPEYDSEFRKWDKQVRTAYRWAQKARDHQPNTKTTYRSTQHPSLKTL
ncbi:MAG: hypothetical protein CV088_17560 [Nitrospira sp. LK70]|nr:hypothetical protein [Nitrospira sp. LK70]